MKIHRQQNPVNLASFLGDWVAGHYQGRIFSTGVPTCSQNLAPPQHCEVISIIMLGGDWSSGALAAEPLSVWMFIWAPPASAVPLLNPFQRHSSAESDRLLIPSAPGGVSLCFLQLEAGTSGTVTVFPSLPAPPGSVSPSGRILCISKQNIVY